MYRIARRKLGQVAAAVTAGLLNSAAFVAIHIVYEPLSLAGALQLFLFSLTAVVLVFLTGRVSSAIIMHLTYNALYLILIAFGLMLE